MPEASISHDEDVWPMPTDPVWISQIQDKLRDLRNRLMHLQNHEHLAASDEADEYTNQFLKAYRNKLSLALRHTTNLRIWFNKTVELERTEVMGWEVKEFSSKANFITRLLLSAEKTSQQISQDPRIAKGYYVKRPPRSDFQMCRTLSKYLSDEIGNHEGYNCKKKGCV